MSQHQTTIVLLQSCDTAYAEILKATSPANAAYARVHGYSYRQVIGTLSPIPHTGNFNRYYLLRDEIERSVHDWAFWMDADAVVTDPGVRLESIIERTPDKMLIACRGADLGDFDVNNGVFLLNLRHPLAASMVDEVVRCCERFGRSNDAFRDDQKHVHSWLKRHQDASGRISFVQRYAGDEYNLFNYDGPFVYHALRESGRFEERLELLQRLASAFPSHSSN